MPICKISHGIRTERGFRQFEAGVYYPASEVGDRGKYFEAEPTITIMPSEEAAEKVSSKRVKKIMEEVTDDAR